MNNAFTTGGLHVPTLAMSLFTFLRNNGLYFVCSATKFSTRADVLSVPRTSPRGMFAKNRGDLS
jgi:hypothetical protein